LLAIDWAVASVNATATTMVMLFFCIYSSLFNKETFWYPVALSTGLVISVGAVVKYFL
jgi:hypothetical protein